MTNSEPPPLTPRYAVTHQVEPLIQRQHGLVQAGRSAQAADVQLQVVPLAIVDQHLLHAGQSGVFSSVQPHQHAAATQLQRWRWAGGGQQVRKSRWTRGKNSTKTWQDDDDGTSSSRGLRHLTSVQGWEWIIIVCYATHHSVVSLDGFTKRLRPC